MTEPTLEQVKRLAEQLSPEDRVQLWQHLAELPDSGIKSVNLRQEIQEQVAWSKNKPGKNLQEITFHRDCRIENGDAVYYLNGVEVFRGKLNLDNYNNLLFEMLMPQKPFLPMSPELRKRIYAGVRKLLGKEGLKITDQQMKKHEPAMLRTMEVKLVKESIEQSTKRVDENLQPVVVRIWDKITHGIIFAAGNELRDSLGVPEQKFRAEEVRDALYDAEWKPLQIILGLTRGGARRRKAEFVWSTEKATKFYQTVEAMPSINDKPIWEYALEQLRANDYDHDTIVWLKSRPAFVDVPEDLLKEAAKVWRQYDEKLKRLPAKDSPKSFAFRHACHKLEYPVKQPYNTLRTKYYEGRKASKNKT